MRIRYFSTARLPGPIVSPSWLKSVLRQPSIKILDASWYMPAEKQDSYGNFKRSHIPGAVFFDIDKVADHSTGLPHMLPSYEQFSKEMKRLDIQSDDTIIVYDQKGIFSAPRAWWTFLAFGAKNVAVLNGGLPGYVAVSQDLEAGAESVTERSTSFWAGTKRKDWVVDLTRMKQWVQKKPDSKQPDSFIQVIDARSAERFQGVAPEPRAGLRGGHIPHSLNLPFTKLLTPINPYLSKDQPQTGGEKAVYLKEESLLIEEFRKAGVNLDLIVSNPIITTCGSGVTASVLTLALHVIGYQNTFLYDGSWSEWGAEKDTPVSKSP